MGEVLSQSEIDNLLKALSSGELDVDEMKNTEEKQVKNYDFARPSKFSKEHLRTLEIIFEHFGRLLSTNLPAYLRKTVNVEVVNSEVVIYSEFSNALSNPVLLGVVGMQPLSGNIIMEMASNLGFAIVDRLLGGAGNALDISRIMRKPTEKRTMPRSPSQTKPMKEPKLGNSIFVSEPRRRPLNFINTFSVLVNDDSFLEMRSTVLFAIT